MKHTIFAPEGTTVEMLDRCRNWAFNNRLPVEIVDDEPALMAEMRSGCGVVIVHSLEQFGDLQDVVTLLADLKRYGWALVVASAGIDTRNDNPPGYSQWRVLEAFAAFAGQEKQLGRPAVEQTPEQKAAVAAHLAEHGLTRFRELGKNIGVNHSLAGRWLRAAQTPPARAS